MCFEEAIIKSFILLVLTFVVAAYIAVSYFKPAYTEVGGINAKDKAVNLREAPTYKSPVVAKLHSGEFAILSAATDKWNYFYKINNKQTILKGDFKLGYSRVFKQYIVKNKRLKQYEGYVTKFSPWVILGLLSLFFILVVRSLFGRQAKKQTLESSGNTASVMASETMAETVAVTDFVSYDSSMEEAHQLALEKKLAKQEEKQKIKQLEREFAENAKKEIAALKSLEDSKNNDIALRDKAISNLKLKLEEAKESARVLGVNLDDGNIDGLVKGRLFELYAAKIWDNDSDTTIEDWTSDKGITEKIYVKTNGNPDFLLSFRGSHKKVAVECKYRGKLNPSDDGKEYFLHLDKDTVIERYKKYKDEEGIEVFILFGVAGTAEKPEHLYLLTLDELYDIKHNNQYGYSTTLTKVKEYEIQEHKLIERVKTCY